MFLPQKLRTALELLLFALVLAFVAANALVIFVDLFWLADSKPSEAFRGAFLGAFFAFIFVRFGDALTKIYDRQARARQALVTLQHRFHEIINTLNDNIFVYGVLQQFQAALGSPPAPVFLSRFGKLSQIGDLLLPLNNIDLVNELISLNTNIIKMNDTTETWHRSYDEVKAAFISKAMNEETYLYNTKEACKHGEIVGSFSAALKEDVITSLAAVRVLSANDTFLGKVVQWTTRDKFLKTFEAQRSQERSRIVAEAGGARYEGKPAPTAVQALRDRMRSGKASKGK